MSDGNNNKLERIKYTERDERTGPARIVQLRKEKTGFTVDTKKFALELLSLPLDIWKRT